MIFRPQQLRHTSIRRNALTLIEVLVVMAIILILMGLFIVGLKQWGDSAKRNTTMTRLESLNGMLSNLDAVGHNQFLTQWFFTQPGVGQVGIYANAFGNVTSDAQTTIYTTPSYTMTANGSSVPVTNNRQMALAYMSYPSSPYPLLAPFASPQVLLAVPILPTTSYMPVTYGIQNKLLSLPDNAKTMAGFPANAIATLPPNSGLPSYLIAGQPVLLDGWGNPILFCPSGGLANVCVNVKGTVSPQPPLVITSPDGRPFWASAGPDGDFVKGDDNIYSFQQQ